MNSASPDTSDPGFEGLRQSVPGSARTLADRAYHTLHEAIITGKLAPATRLPIDELADSLGMSPMPIREAVRRLDAVGLVEHVPHRGATVTDLSLGDLMSVYEARLALEPMAVSRAAARGEDLADAGKALEDLIKPGQPRSTQWAAHTSFHLALYQASGSSWLMRLITPLWESSERYRLSADAGSVDIRAEEHTAIYDAVVSGSGELAETLMFNHLATTANLMAQTMGGGQVFPLRALGRI